MQIKISNKNIWLNCNHLYYFYVIAKEGSITKASKSLSLGLPTLSYQLKQLESSLGVELFERKNKKMTLTEAGIKVFSFAEEMYLLGKRMGETIGQTISNKIKIKVGVHSSVSKVRLLDIFKAISSSGNESVRVIEEPPDILFNQFAQKKIDLLILNHLPTNLDYNLIASKKLATSPIIICGHKKFENLINKFPGSLKLQPFIMPLPSSKLRMDMDHYFNRNGVEVDIIGESQDINMQKILAQEGIGLICTSSSLLPELTSMGLIEIGRPDKVVEIIHLLYHKDVSEDSLVAKIVKNL